MDIPGLMLLVPGKTGVVYEHQHGGAACRLSEIEGFLLPVSMPDGDRPLQASRCDAVAIAAAVSRMSAWTGGDPSQRTTLTHSGPITDDNEAMLQVTSPWGPAWLIWENSD